MMRYGKTLFAATAAVVACASLGASVASAVTLSYTTSGTFTNTPAGSTLVNTAGSSVLTIGGSVLTFFNTLTPQNFGPETFNGTGQQAAFFGSMSLTSTTSPLSNPSTDSFAGVGFQLTINQSLPTPAAQGVTSGTLSGTVNSVGGGVITFVFSPNGFAGAPGVTNPLTINTIGYTIQQPASVKVNQVATIEGGVLIPAGTPNVAPLPPSAYAGLAMLTLLGTSKLRRKLSVEA